MKRKQEPTNDNPASYLSHVRKTASTISHTLQIIRPALNDHQDPMWRCILGLFNEYLKSEHYLNINQLIAPPSTAVESTHATHSSHGCTLSDKNIHRVYEEQCALLTKWHGILLEWHVYKNKNRINSKMVDIVQDVSYVLVKEILVERIVDGKIDIPVEEVKKLYERHGEILVECVSKLITTKVIGFPYKKFTMGEPLDKFKNLCNHTPQFSTENFELPGIKFKTDRFFSWTYLGKYHTIISSNDDYFNIDILTEYFTEHPRMNARRKDQTQTPLQYWESKQGSLKIVKKVIKDKQNLDTFNLREAIYGTFKECTQFKCSLTRAIIQKFSASRVLDFSAGWGDRLIGAIASNVQYYVGVDPNKNLSDGHRSAIETLIPNIETRKNFQMIYEPFQSCTLPEGKTFDLIFTSPPFFNFEIYTDLDGQSVKDFPRFSDWLLNFLLVSLRKAWERLDVNGHMAIHLTDTRGSEVCEIMNLFIQAKLKGSFYEGVIAARGVADLPRPIWVWKKVDVADKERVEQAEKYMAQYFKEYYGSIQKL